MTGTTIYAKNFFLGLPLFLRWKYSVVDNILQVLVEHPLFPLESHFSWTSTSLTPTFMVIPLFLGLPLYLITPTAHEMEFTGRHLN
jgi:hypothetical protein